MKKLLMLMAAVLTINLTACGNSSSSGGSTDGKSSAVQDSSGKSASDSSSGKKGKKNENAFLEEQVIAEQDDLKVIASYEEMSGEPGIKISFENNTGRNLGVFFRDFCVNNYSYRLVETVTVDKESKGSKRLTSWYMSPGLIHYGFKIENAEQVSISFRVFDDDTNELLFDVSDAQITTDPLQSEGIAKYDEGTELYNEDGLRIVGKYIVTDRNSRVMCFIENNSGKYLNLETSRLLVNGIEMSPDGEANLDSGKMAFLVCTLEPEDLEENKIESVEEIEMSFEITDEPLFSNIGDGPFDSKTTDLFEIPVE